MSNPQPLALPDDVVLSVRGVSKKFCRNLRRSMWYGIQDLSRNLIGLSTGSPSSSPSTNNEQRMTKNVGEAAIQSPNSPIYQSQISNLQSTNNESPITNNEAEGLRKDEFWAVKDISFDLRKGECLGLIGQNGCGKSTLLRLLTGVFPPDEGQVISRGRTSALIALGAGFHPHLTGRENVFLNGSILGLTKKEIKAQLEEIIDFAEIDEFVDAPVSTYSSGMRVRLGFAVATALKPDILLVDEVLAVGDAAFRFKCFNRIQKLLKNAAVIFVTHSMPMISRFCTCGLFMDRGKNQILSNNVECVISAYLGKVDVELPTISNMDGVTLQSTSVNKKSGGIVNHNGIFVIDVQVRIPKTFQEVKAAFTVFDLEQRPVWCTKSQHAGIKVTNNSGLLKITAEVFRINLSPGKYSLTVWINNADESVLLLRYDNACTFQVKSEFIVGGAQTFDVATWEIDND